MYKELAATENRKQAIKSREKLCAFDDSSEGEVRRPRAQNTETFPVGLDSTLMSTRAGATLTKANLNAASAAKKSRKARVGSENAIPEEALV